MSGIGDRQMRPIPGFVDEDEISPVSVSVHVAAEWATTAVGQHIAWMLISLLVRQVKVVSRVEIDCPATKLLVDIPLIRAENLRDALLQSGERCVGGEVRVSLEAQPNCDFNIKIGSPDDATNHDLFVVADGWRGHVSRSRPGVQASTSHVPLGAYVAASLAAAEVFKTARRPIKSSKLTAGGLSAWSGQASDDWGDLAAGPELTGFRIPPFYVVGAGAVGQAFVLCLAASLVEPAACMVVDHDRLDSTNLNRCVLSGTGDDEEFKTDNVLRFCSGKPLHVHAYSGTLTQYVADLSRTPPQPFARTEANGEYEVVISCVDKEASRHDIQGLKPSLVFDGSTTDLQAKSARYDPKLGDACVACSAIKEPHAAELQGLEGKLRKMSDDELSAFCETHSLTVKDVKAYLDSGECGLAVEDKLRGVAANQAAQFSVGFVSVTAGVLLAGRFIRYFMEEGTCHLPQSISYHFRTNRSIDFARPIDAGCQCQSTLT